MECDRKVPGISGSGKKIKTFLKKLLFFFKKAVIFFWKFLIFLKNVLIFDVEFYSGHIRFHIRPHEFVRTYNYMGRTCKKHVFWCGKNIVLLYSPYFYKWFFFVSAFFILLHF